MPACDAAAVYELTANRFHAWQSSLLFAFVFVIHIIFSWSSVISWLLFVGDLGLIGFLTMHAYQDGNQAPLTLHLPTNPNQRPLWNDSKYPSSARSQTQ